MIEPYLPIVLVTGSSQGGIGYALCEAFANRGCKVYASARRLEAMKSLSAHRIDLLKLDVDDHQSCVSVVDTIIKKEGRIDIFISNAGVGATGALLDFSIEDAQKVLNTNVLAALQLAQLIVPHMHEYFLRTGRRGLIGTVGSIVGDIPTPWSGIYAVSKAALHSLTNVLRMETSRLGCDVMLIAPGAVTSRFGVRQTNSFKPREDSLYRNMQTYIYARAMMGQQNSMANAVFAKGLVDACLRPYRAWYNPLSWLLGSGPPAYYSKGGGAFLFWLFGFLPTLLQFWIIGRATGAHKVIGKAKAKVL